MQTTAEQQVSEHPDFPSLLSVSDALKDFGVENVAIKTETADLPTYPTPFIVQIRTKGNKEFTVISKISFDTITYMDTQSHKEIKTTVNEFNAVFTGYAMLVEAGEHAGEKDYRQNLQKENRLLFFNILATIAFPLLTIIACIVCFIVHGATSVPAIVYTLVTLFGALVGAMLIWYDIDRYNPALKQVCSLSKKTSCQVIMDSNGSKIFGIKWSVIGFTYFAGELLALLVSGIYKPEVLFVLCWLNVLALPDMLYSITYQGFIAKKWCPMCLTMQFAMALQFVVAYWGGMHTIFPIKEITATTVVMLITLFVLFFLVVSLLEPAMRAAKENKRHLQELQRLKHNPQILVLVIK